jgi:hypothetical protein
MPHPKHHEFMENAIIVSFFIVAAIMVVFILWLVCVNHGSIKKYCENRNKDIDKERKKVFQQLYDDKVIKGECVSVPLRDISKCSVCAGAFKCEASLYEKDIKDMLKTQPNNHYSKNT